MPSISKSIPNPGLECSAGGWRAKALLAMVQSCCLPGSDLFARSIDDVVLGKDWHHAFEHTGVLSGQVNMSLKAFGWESSPRVGDGLPVLGQKLPLCFHVVQVPMLRLGSIGDQLQNTHPSKTLD